MRKPFLIIDEQLDHLMKTHEPTIKSARQLSKLMHEAGVLQYSDTPGVTREESINHQGSSINNHLHGQHIEYGWLKAYCDFFGCSADYLLGYIREETHELTDIAEATGLSEAAIHNIKSIKENDSRLLFSMNFLLESKVFIGVLIDLYEYENRRLHCSVAREEMDSAETDEEYYEREKTFLADQDSMISWEYRIGRSLDKIIDAWEEEIDSCTPEERIKKIQSFIPYAV